MQEICIRLGFHRFFDALTLKLPVLHVSLKREAFHSVKQILIAKQILSSSKRTKSFENARQSSKRASGVYLNINAFPFKTFLRSLGFLGTWVSCEDTTPVVVVNDFSVDVSGLKRNWFTRFMLETFGLCWLATAAPIQPNQRPMGTT